MTESKTTGYHESNSKLKVFTSYVGNTTTRLECHDCITAFMKVDHNTIHQVLRLDRNEMLTMREVLNRWFDTNEINR